MGASPLSLAPSSSTRHSTAVSSQADGKLGDIAVLKNSDAPTQDRGVSVLRVAPLRKAVITHARSLSRALRLFEFAVSDGGKTKAVVNGPVRAHLERKLSPWGRVFTRYVRSHIHKQTLEQILGS